MGRNAIQLFRTERAKCSNEWRDIFSPKLLAIIQEHMRAQWLHILCNHCARRVLQQHRACTMVARIVQPLWTLKVLNEVVNRVLAKLSMHNGCTNCATNVHAQVLTPLRRIFCEAGRAQRAHNLCAHCARPV